MKWEELKMSFVYEMVGEENRELWESIGWKDVVKSPKRFLSGKQSSIFLSMFAIS